MLWLLPVEHNQQPFATVKMQDDYVQLEPLFPSGSDMGETMTRVQGAVIKDNTLIIHRSYTTGYYASKQLVVIEYDDILAEEPVVKAFFSGSNDDKHQHKPKNWLSGCEDLTLVDGELWTITDFVNDRYIYCAKLVDIEGLLQPVNKSG